MKLLYTFSRTDFPAGSKIVLPVGLKKKKIKIRNSSAGDEIKEIGFVNSNTINNIPSIEFPIINGKSPNTFTISRWEGETREIIILIEEIGGIPDPLYFSDTQP